jgi:hypothetical protein
MIKDRAPAFQSYPRQFAGDDRVMGMDLEAIGAHILLMCAAAASPQRYRIDAEEYAIRMRLRNPSDEAWVRIKKQLLAGAWKVSSDGKWWIQSGLERTFQKQKEFSDKQRTKANRKWGKDGAEPLPESCQSDAAVMPEGMPKACSSSSSSSSNLKSVGANLESCQSDAAVMPEGFNSTSVAQIVCQKNGWSGNGMIWALQAAIEFQSKRMPEAVLEQVGEWLVKAYCDHQIAKGQYAVKPQKFFEQGLYRPTADRRETTSNILTDNPATRALAQMEVS